MNTLNKETIHPVYLHLGSNLGDRLRYLLKAKFLINKHIGHIKTLSEVYETAAWGKTDQPDFYNQAILVITQLTPAEVLTEIHQIENILGRNRKPENHWGERTIDIDILFYNNQIINSPSLTIPHRHLQDRNFVLIPLCEIAPNFIHPVLGKSIQELRKLCADDSEVKKCE